MNAPSPVATIPAVISKLMAVSTVTGDRWSGPNDLWIDSGKRCAARFTSGRATASRELLIFGSAAIGDHRSSG
jgi:hypothetical protein